MSKETVRRIRWYDPESDDPSTPVDWPVASLILATLFLNFYFMNGVGLWQFCPLPLYALFVGAVALLVTTLFFMGPALATHAAGRPLFLVIADSLGSIPAFGLHLCCVLYLVLWIAKTELGVFAVAADSCSPGLASRSRGGLDLRRALVGLGSVDGLVGTG